VASLLNMKSVTPRSIAYICAQVHYTLSSSASWTVEHEGFNYQAFYNFIVDYLENTSTV
ncbi:hypothetical protein BDQ17DRAFT_1252137, partial [Cyathus striatus]